MKDMRPLRRGEETLAHHALVLHDDHCRTVSSSHHSELVNLLPFRLSKIPHDVSFQNVLKGSRSILPDT